MQKRAVPPDPIYHSETVTKFINCMMRCGKKSLAERIFYRAMERIREQIKDEEPLQVFLKAIENAKPILEVKSRRVGGSTYQVPVEVAPHRQQSLAFRWIIQFARSRSGRSMEEKLAAELIDCYRNQGNTIKKREDTHRMAEANKAFAHYRW